MNLIFLLITTLLNTYTELFSRGNSHGRQKRDEIRRLERGI